MAPAISKFDMENGRKKRDMYAVKPAIPLERPKRAKYDPSELVKFELYRNPEDTSSAKYTISILSSVVVLQKKYSTFLTRFKKL